jgi:hypothetical protein
VRIVLQGTWQFTEATQVHAYQPVA